MRKIQLIALWLVALTAQAQVKYKVNVENAPKSQTLYLVTAIRGNVLDSLTTDTQGRGTLEGQADEGCDPVTDLQVPVFQVIPDVGHGSDEHAA